jgi:hypothetical protein
LILISVCLLQAEDRQGWFDYFFKPVVPIKKAIPQLPVNKLTLSQPLIVVDSSVGTWVFKPDAVVMMSCFEYTNNKFTPGIFTGFGAGLSYEREISIKGNVTTFSLQINMLGWGSKDSSNKVYTKYGPMIGVNAFNGWGLGVAKDVKVGSKAGYYILFSYSRPFGQNSFPF